MNFQSVPRKANIGDQPYTRSTPSRIRNRLDRVLRLDRSAVRGEALSLGVWQGGNPIRSSALGATSTWETIPE